MTLADEDTGVVDRLGETELVDAGLKTALQEILNLQGQHYNVLVFFNSVL